MLTMGPRSLQPHTPPVVPTNLRCFCRDPCFHGIFCSEELSSVLHNYQQPNVRLCSSFIIACWISLRDNKTDPQILAPWLWQYLEKNFFTPFYFGFTVHGVGDWITTMVNFTDAFLLMIGRRLLKIWFDGSHNWNRIIWLWQVWLQEVWQVEMGIRCLLG